MKKKNVVSQILPEFFWKIIQGESKKQQINWVWPKYSATYTSLVSDIWNIFHSFTWWSSFTRWPIFMRWPTFTWWPRSTMWPNFEPYLATFKPMSCGQHMILHSDEDLSVNVPKQWMVYSFQKCVWWYDWENSMLILFVFFSLFHVLKKKISICYKC